MRRLARSLAVFGFIVAWAIGTLGPSLAVGPTGSGLQGGTRLVVFEAFMNPY